LLQEVKGLYNEKYPEDHTDDAGHEVGYDADGLLWVKFTGQGIERSEVERLEDLLKEVKDLYNERYTQDHVDDTDREVGMDADGLLWVRYTGQGPVTWHAKVEKLEDLLEEVKELYNERYPQDHVDDTDREVGTDADGLLWVRYSGHAAEMQEQQVDRLETLLQEVKGLYNARYPEDHVDDADREVGTDADGLLWVRYTGDHADGQERKLGELQDLLQEVKALYSERYPLDHVDDVGHEAGIDADGLHWVAYTGQGTRKREDRMADVEELLEEVKGMYNDKYPLDHVDDEATEVGFDSDGLLWTCYSGQSGRSAQQIVQLEDLLEEVKHLYSQRYHLDDVDDIGRETGYDADGLLWVKHTGSGMHAKGAAAQEEQEAPVRSESKMERLQDMLSEVRRLYNEKYPLDSVDDLGHEAGCDRDGLLWVKYTGLGTVAAVEAAA